LVARHVYYLLLRVCDGVLYSAQILACIIRLTTLITLLSNICPY